MTNFYSSRTIFIFLIMFFSLISMSVNAQSVIGSITEGSMGTCGITLNVCANDTILLQPSNTTDYTNLVWYSNDVLPSQLIDQTAVSNNQYYVLPTSTLPTLKIAIPVGVTSLRYILTGNFSTPSGCAAKNDTINFIINPLPTVNDAALSTCSLSGSSASFNLTDANDDITGGVSGVTVSYYTTLDDAKSGSNQLSTPYSSSGEILFARVENNLTGCYSLAQLTLSLNSFTASAIAGDILCNGGTTDATVTPNGGTAPYSILPLQTGLTAGNYTFTVTDANGCSATASVIISEPILLTASATSGAVCDGNTTDLTITPSGGTAPYSVSPSQTGLGVGNYTFTVTDANGCTTTVATSVTLNPSPEFTLNKPQVCPGENEELAINDLTNAIRETDLYKIGNGSYNSPIPVIISGLPIGVHTITIQNANGCETIKSIEILAPIAKVCLPVSITKL